MTFATQSYLIPPQVFAGILAHGGIAQATLTANHDLEPKGSAFIEVWEKRR